MILFENSILRLDYNPATDILVINYPDLKDFLLLEIKHSLDRMFEVIKNYDIKKLILDSSQMQSTVTEEEGREVAVYLATGLIGTRVQKVARVQSNDNAIEKRAEGNVNHIRETASLPFELRNFSTREEAITWLAAQ